MNYRLFFRLLSVIVSTIAAAFMASFAFGILYSGDGLTAAEYHGWTYSIVCALALSTVLLLLGRGADNKFFRKEAFAVIGVGWIVTSLLGSLPYILILPQCSIADAVFESTSGLTTTGASAFDDFASFPLSLLFWRSLSQWIGGLGVIVLFVALLSFLGAGAKILFSNESTGQSAELTSGRVRSGVLRIIGIYGILSAACYFALLACGIGWMDALVHMFTTVSTGGFSFHADSIAHFDNPFVEWVIIVFMILGGVSFFVHEAIFQRNWAIVRRNTELAAYCIILLLISTLLGVMLIGEMPSDIPRAIREAVFQTVSIVTTTGFTTADYDSWLPVGQKILLFAMLIGGCSGSTSGGTKVVRMLVAAKVCWIHLEKAYRPRVVRTVRMNGQIINAEAQANVMTHVVLLVLVSLFSIGAVAMMEQQISVVGIYSVVIATLYNIGPGFAEIGPTQSFSGLQEQTKFFLSLLMIMGRLELYAILVLFSPSLWRRFS